MDFSTLLAFFLSSAITVWLIVPIVGVVTRFRINYTPKGVGLGETEEGDSQRLSQDMRVGPVVNSPLAMFLRVKRIEGYQGLYKGLMPLLLTAILQHILSYIFISGGGTSPRYAISSQGLWGTILWCFFIVIWSIPREILVNRAICTPHKLPWLNPRLALRVLFTSYERQNPWRLYFTPGIALAQALHVIYFFTVVRGARSLFVPSFTPGYRSSWGVLRGFWPFVGFVVYILFLCLGFIVLCPLEVLAARLSVQRNHYRSAGGVPAPVQEELPPGLEYSGENEDVIGLRDEDQPYEGLLDAMRKIVEEEGWSTLYRAFYLTLFGTVFAGLT
ncbi:mitochondrial carrier [Cantharellus anzutake]|uniref:mitochondrial carrier n=1 Tax=Cantharellus anzutake TaxID=1750568 RepID=UPI0019059C38|nr:mitochondrial carrier [Cantharellus anzutake]KAF8326607.1 mitochondrial carrier [Cantharellus anzutake]